MKKLVFIAAVGLQSLQCSAGMLPYADRAKAQYEFIVKAGGAMDKYIDIDVSFHFLPEYESTRTALMAARKMEKMIKNGDVLSLDLDQESFSRLKAAEQLRVQLESNLNPCAKKIEGSISALYSQSIKKDLQEKFDIVKNKHISDEEKQIQIDAFLNGRECALTKAYQSLQS